jgi:hypothetical protein
MASSVKNIMLTGDVYTPKLLTQADLADEEGVQQKGGRQSRRRRRGGGVALTGGADHTVLVSKTMDGYREPMGPQAPTYAHAHGAPLSQAFRPVIPVNAVVPVAAAAAPTPQGFQYGGASHTTAITHPTREIKVHLRPKHTGPAASRKVHLKPKRIAGDAPQKKLKMRHKTRKITLGLASLAKRQTRAKKIKEAVAEMPLAELRAHLVKKGLIKESSKAPESILRQIAADAQIVAGKGL